MIRHHPSKDILRGFAAGGFAPALQPVVAAHLDLCALCRREAALLDCVGGALLETIEPAAMRADAFDAAWARINDTAPATQSLPKPEDANILPPSLRPALASARERWLAPGIHMTLFWNEGGKGGRSYLLRAGPGRALPHHGHAGAEMTCVLSGAFHDGDTRYGPGDFLEAGDSMHHQPRVDAGAECICVIGSEAPPRGHGLAGLVMRARM